jgi:uncharacterized membrane protein
MRAGLSFYVVAFVAYLAIDMAWLSVAATPVYRETLGDIMLPQIRLGPALAVYLLQALGLAVFVLPRAMESGGGAATGYGFLFGLFTYGLYDLTNLATLKHWVWGLSLTDMAWGGVVSALASLIGWLVARRFVRQRIFK